MSSTTSTLEPARRGLRRDALGLPALIFSIATAAAPMTALLFNVPVIVAGAGWAARPRSWSPPRCWRCSRSGTSR
jgi:hypothetical protein